VKSRIAAWATFAVLSLVYFLSNHPYVGRDDSAEFQTMAKTGGVAHAAYPTFVLALETFGRLPWSTYAFRANLLCSLTGALACALAAWHGARLSGRAWTGAAAGVALGLGFQLWKSSTMAEIYAFTLALGACIFHLAWILARRPSARVSCAIGVLGGLGIGAHLMVIALVPVVLVALAASTRIRRLRGPLVLALLGGFALGLLPLGYAMSQDRPDHPMNYLAMKRLPGEANAAPTLAKRAADIAYLLSGRQYLAPTAEARTLRGTAVRFRYVFYDFALYEFLLLGPLLGALGVFVVWRRYDLDGLLLATCGAASVALIWYAAVLPEMAATYFVTACWILAVCIAVALGWIADRARAPAIVLAIGLLAAPFARLALPRVGAGWIEAASRVMPGEWHPFRADPSWDEYALGVFKKLPERAILLGNWTELMALKYEKHAQFLRPDVDLVLTELPRELADSAPRALALGRPVYTTLPFAPETPGLDVRPSGTWTRGGLWEIRPLP
jgi:hypothetical protein